MQLTVNGKTFETNEGINVIELLKEKEVKSPDMVSVEINGKILKKEQFSNTILQNDDQVEFLYFMGGGQAL